MSKKLKIFGAIFILALAISSCSKRDKYPIEPVIKFYSFTKIDNGFNVDDKAILSLSFTDGDGDIGLDISDTAPPFNLNGDYYNNCIIDYYEKQKGNFVKVVLPFSMNARIPKIYAQVANRGIRGNIEIELFVNNVLSSYDTIRFTAHIYDRALHKSNEVITPEFVIDKKP